MASIRPGDHFVRIYRYRTSRFECRSVQRDAFDPQGGVALFRWQRSGFERMVPLRKLDAFLKTARLEA